MYIFRLFFILFLLFLFGCVDNNYIFNKLNSKFYLRKIWDINIDRDIIKYNINYSISFNKNEIFIYNHYGIVKAISLKDGKQIWSSNLLNIDHNFRDDGILLLSNICVDVKNIYIGSENAKLYSINVHNGSINWSVDTVGEVISKPFLFHNLILVHTVNGMLQAFDKYNGSIKWNVFLGYTNLGIKGESEPTIFNNLIVIGSDNGFINVISPYDGKIIWKKFISYTFLKYINNHIDIDFTPLIYDGVIYVISCNGDLLAVDFLSGDILYKYNISFIKSFFIYNKHIYMFDSSNYLISLNISSYYIEWKKKISSKCNLTIPILYNNSIIIGDSLGYVYLININDGIIYLKYKINFLGISNIFYKKNKLFILDNDGNLFFFQKK